MSNEQIPILRLMTIGDTGVGKTSMILRYTEDQFPKDHLATIGVDFKVKETEIDSRKVKVQIWDTAGQERFAAIPKSYFNKADGIFVVFDLSKRDTYDKTQKLIDSVSESGSDCSIILVGNKCDIENRSITEKEAEEFANLNAIKYFETSAKDGTNISQAFTYLATISFRRKPYEQFLKTEPKQAKETKECKC